ncbi:hypothetical protein CQW23_32936 [Capsicum baccatum]|uniref:Uncharacterized protein n=1 Tax=Capsicum baccatum TaxID=33114 RepID=A0A2G2V3B9_CAPBA|nr:hypothetical protein CQW23_32936 [Capsicum baccatum]
MHDFYGVLQKRLGTAAGRKRTHPTHNDIDDINEAKKRCKTNALWGVELKPGKPFTHNFEKERGRLHVSQSWYVELPLQNGCVEASRVVGNNLSSRRITLLVFNVIEVLRVGDPYEEGSAEIDSESSDSIKFEDVAEDGDKDGSTDDAFKILEEEEPRDESGTLKRPKKKKHHLNVTDDKSATSKKLDGIEDEDTHEEALNEKARGTDVDERKGLQRIVCEDTSKTYDYQRKRLDGEELAGAHPEHVEANYEPIDDDFSMYLPSPVPNSGGGIPYISENSTSRMESAIDSAGKPPTRVCRKGWSL